MITSFWWYKLKSNKNFASNTFNNRRHDVDILEINFYVPIHSQINQNTTKNNNNIQSVDKWLQKIHKKANNNSNKNAWCILIQQK